MNKKLLIGLVASVVIGLGVASSANATTHMTTANAKNAYNAKLSVVAKKGKAHCKKSKSKCAWTHKTMKKIKNNKATRGSLK